MSEPVRNLMTDMLDKQLLTYAVQKAIFCPRTGQVLDMRSAVLVTLTRPGGEQHSAVMTASAWDDVQDAVRERVAGTGVQIEVRDGRELFGRKRGRR